MESIWVSCQDRLESMISELNTRGGKRFQAEREKKEKKSFSEVLGQHWNLQNDRKHNDIWNTSDFFFFEKWGLKNSRFIFSNEDATMIDYIQKILKKKLLMWKNILEDLQDKEMKYILSDAEISELAEIWKK